MSATPGFSRGAIPAAEAPRRGSRPAAAASGRLAVVREAAGIRRLAGILLLAGKLQLAAAAVASLLAATPSLAAGPAAAPPPPHIVVVLIDDLGWGDLACFGGTRAATPAIDRLAAEGIRFTQFYSNSPICSPSRVAFSTGQYPQRWRIGSYLAERGANDRRGIAHWLEPEAPMLARLLAGAGYRTGHFGKWHMGGQRDVADAPPISAYGFDASLTNFEGIGPKLLPLTIGPGGRQGRIWADAERLGGPVTWMNRAEITGGYVAAAIEFLDAAAATGRPAYVNVWPDDVHSPFWPPLDRWSDEPGGRFRGVLEAMDAQLGRLFDHVRSTPGLRDRTLVLVCSDNGPEPGAGSAGPLRGAKTTLYEGGVRSPLVAWGPGVIAPAAAGTTDDASVFAAFDLAPSLATMAGVEPPAGVAFDGSDVSAAIRGAGPASHPGAICWRRPPDRKTWQPLGDQRLPDLAIRDGRWKLLCDYDGGGRQLYDLEQDRSETKNLAADHPDVVGRLADAVVAWHRSLPADRGPELGAAAAAPKRSP